MNLGDDELRRCETELRALRATPGAAALLNERLGAFLGAASSPDARIDKNKAGIMLEIKRYTGKDCDEATWRSVMTLITGPFNGFSLQFMPNRPNVNGTDPHGNDHTTTPPSLNKPDDIYQFMHAMDAWVYSRVADLALEQTYTPTANGITVKNVHGNKTITATASGTTLTFAFTDASK